LALVSRAEELVCREEEEEGGATHQERLTGALTILHRGIATLTAATTPQHPLTFQIQFLRCRAAVLQVRWPSMTYSTVPPSPPTPCQASLTF
jgi:hypothetical protein